MQAVTAIVLWGVLGVLAIIGQAIFRLTPLALHPLRHGNLAGWQYAVIGVWTVVSLYSEGYKGFQKAFAPRVVARALHLARHPRPLFVALAPLYCMSFFHATRRRLIFQYVFITVLVGVILIVQALDQPWRGIVDCGVVAGLIYGCASIVWYLIRGLSGHPMPVSADVPEPAPTA
jgi:hypothetical protein